MVAHLPTKQTNQATNQPTNKKTNKQTVQTPQATQTPQQKQKNTSILPHFLSFVWHLLSHRTQLIAE